MSKSCPPNPGPVESADDPGPFAPWKSAAGPGPATGWRSAFTRDVMAGDGGFPLDVAALDARLTAAKADYAADLATVLNLEAGLRAIVGDQGDGEDDR